MKTAAACTYDMKPAECHKYYGVAYGKKKGCTDVRNLSKNTSFPIAC